MAKHSRAIYFLSVVAVAISNVVFVPHWQSGPFSSVPKSNVGTYETWTTSAETVDQSTALNGKTVALPSKSMRDNADTPVAKTPASLSAISGINASAEQTSPQPKCDIAACTRAFQSFRNSDCTYQPSSGPRRLCRKSIVASNPNDRSSERCNVNACTAAYRSFDPSDCTYQPSEGPRRLCAK